MKRAERHGGGPLALLASAKLLFLLVAGAALAVDLWTKALFFSHSDSFARNTAKAVIENFFYIKSAQNKGGVFGTLQEHTFLLAALSLLALIVAGVILFRLKRRQVWLHIALALIIGGALGNIYDRLLLKTPGGEAAHYVRDFLDFHILGFDYPIFNAADAFICVGAAMVVLRVLLDGRTKGRTPDGK